MSLLDRLIKPVYDSLLRPHLPNKIAVFNGVAVRRASLFDRTDVVPEYEWPLIDAIRARVTAGDTVVIVGGGLGISSVVAARQTGPSGDVITYEASRDRYADLQETAELNGVANTITRHHAVVGTDISISGTMAGAETVPPSELPECDVLVMDCEGAEKTILEGRSISARCVIVETHGFLGAPEHSIEKLLTEAGYEIVARKQENLEVEVPVLTAVRTVEHD